MYESYPFHENIYEHIVEILGQFALLKLLFWLSNWVANAHIDTIDLSWPVQNYDKIWLIIVFQVQPLSRVRLLALKLYELSL